MNGSLLRAELLRIAGQWEAVDPGAWSLGRGPSLHDPQVCGLEEPGDGNPCPGCCPQGEREQARLAVLAEYGEASRALSDMFFLLLRHATADDHEALRAYFTELLRPELEALADRIIALERQP